MTDRSLIDEINPTFIALTAMAIHHCLSAWKIAEFGVLPVFGPGGGAQHKCDTIHINHAVNNAFTDVFRRLYVDFRSSSPEVQSKKIDNIRRMIRRRINYTGRDPAMAQPHNDQGGFDEDFLHYFPEELIEQPNNSFIHLSIFGAATEASMRFPAVLPAVASGSQLVPCTDSNSNSNDLTNMTSIENTGLVDGSTIVERAMWLGGKEWCQWSNLGSSLCAILF